VHSNEFNVAVNFWWLPFSQDVLTGMNEGIRALGTSFPSLAPQWQRYVAALCRHFFVAPADLGSSTDEV
jgi:hypothetical protein